MTQAEFDEASMKALSLFEFGQVSYKAIHCKCLKESYADHTKSDSLCILRASILKSCALLEGLLDSKYIMIFFQRVAKEHGLILVDTKYEFGRSSDGSILLIDEVSLILSLSFPIISLLNAQFIRIIYLYTLYVDSYAGFKQILACWLL